MSFFFEGLWHLSWWGIAIFTLVATHYTCLAVTVFLHRCQAHRSVELHPVIEHFFRFWLWLSTGMVTKEWTAVHRKHHAVVETEEDPHSPIIHGIWKVVFGGVGLYQKEACKPETLKTFGRGTPDDWLENTIYAPRHIWGVVVMAIIDIALFGVFPGALVWLVQMIWIPLWAAGVINGIGHYWGYRNFATKDASTNIVPWGILIAGEELHNNHHAYASSARLSNKWFEFDIGWMYIRIFEILGLAHVKKVSPKVCFDEKKTVCDHETLKAVVLHRLHVMANFKKAIKHTYSEELRKIKETTSGPALSDIAALENVKPILYQDNTELPAEASEQLNSVLSKHAMLQRIYQMKMSLVSFWDSASGTQEQLVDNLNEWCHQAEQSGIDALANFSRRLKTYSLA
ncbi:MAG: fatty acid desaturase [bacterium]|nr:fatty acid desaturase [bacterium]